MQVARQGTTYFVLVSSSEDGPVMVAMKIAFAQLFLPTSSACSIEHRFVKKYLFVFIYHYQKTK